MDSKKILTLISLVLVISILGTIYSISELTEINTIFRSISGMANNDAGNVTLNLSGTVSMEVIRNLATIGTGFVKSGSSNCTFTTGGDKFNGNPWARNSTHTDIYPNGITINGGFAHQNSDNGECGGPDWNNTDFRESGVHVIENTGNLEIDIYAKIESVFGYSGGGPNQNTCAFLTGYGDNDGADGCSTNGSSTRSDIPVTMGVYTIPAYVASNSYIFDADDSLPVDVPDNEASVGITTGGLMLGILNINSSNQIISTKMQWENYQDEVGVGFSFVIPSDAIPGQRHMKIRYTAQEH